MDFVQIDFVSGVLEFIIVIGGIGQVVEWMIGNIEFYYFVVQCFQVWGLGLDFYVFGDWGCIGGRGVFVVFDFDQVYVVGVECFELVGGVEFWDVCIYF